MKPIYQTKFGSKEGNCFQACIASILEISIEDVPDIDPAGKAENDQLSWPRKLNQWLNDKYKIQYTEFTGYPIGWGMHVGHHTIVGLSPRFQNEGLHHAVVAFNSKMVHDPIGPDGPGIVENKEKQFGYFLKIM